MWLGEQSCASLLSVWSHPELILLPARELSSLPSEKFHVLIRPRKWGHCVGSAPVIQDMAFIGNGDPRPFQVSNRSKDIPVFHIAAGGIIQTNDQQTRMMARGYVDHHVQILPI